MNQRLQRGLPGTPEASAPVRIVHLGVGNFHRAHQAWYTQHAPDAEEWGIAAFTGRRPDQAEALAPQDGLYTLLTKAPDGDRAEIISSLVAVHPASEHEQYLNYLARASTAVVTLTLTEQAYRRDARGHLDTEDDGVAGDLQVLRTDPRGRVSSMPARIVAGLLARRSAGAGPLTILPCDNLPDNGHVLRTLVLDAAAAVDPALAGWVEDQVDFATSMVDRITPAITDEDRDLALRLTGYADAAPVQTEPFSEWVISGEFPAGRPDWEPAGVRFVSDVGPHELRKLWLLNGAHSLLAYAGSVRGHETIVDAVGDERLRACVEQFWDEAQRHLEMGAAEIADYRAALLRRFENPRMRDALARIAKDGSQKLPVRILPVVAAERAAGRVPVGAATALAGWVLHLRGQGAPVSDEGAESALAAARGELAGAADDGDLTAAVPAVLETLQAGLGEDADLVAAVVEQAGALAR